MKYIYQIQKFKLNHQYQKSKIKNQKSKKPTNPTQLNLKLKDLRYTFTWCEISFQRLHSLPKFEQERIEDRGYQHIYS